MASPRALALLPLTSVILLAATVAAASAPKPLAEEALLGRRVAVTLVGKPVREVLKALSSEELELQPSPELAEVKATVSVRDEPLHTVMTRLAQVFGGEWRTGAKPGRYELRRASDVADWLRGWRRARAEAEQVARKIQEDTVRRIIQEALAELGRLPDSVQPEGEARPRGIGEPLLARLVGTLQPEELEALVRHIAAVSPVRTGGGTIQAPPPIVKRYSELSPAQQRLVRDWLTGGPGQAPINEVYERRLDRLHDTLIEFGTDVGIGVELFFHPPPPDEVYGGFAVGAHWGAHKMESMLHEDLMRRLSRRKTPAGALLGASLTPEGRVEPLVKLTDPALADRMLTDLPPRPMAPEFLAAAAAGCGLNLVADHHTRSARLEVPRQPGRLADLLEAAAPRFELVFRQEGGYLLARRYLWPDRDEEETPAPWPERWISQKKDGQGLTLDDFLVLNRLTEPQLAGLAAYADGPLRFSEVETARKRFWIWALVSALPAEQRRRAETRRGVMVRDLAFNHRSFLARAIGAPLDWDNLALLVLPFTSPGDSSKDFRVYLLAPGSNVPAWSSENLGSVSRLR
jgi:hypothetical protein